MRTCGSKRLAGIAALGLTAALASVACSGGGGSPTAPPVVTYPQIAGEWSGDWVVVELGPAPIRATLSQSGSVISGTLSVEELPVPIEGTLSARDASGQGVLTWQVPASAIQCGYMRGTLVVSPGDAKMQGPGTVSTVGCDDQPETFDGTVTLSRTAGAATIAAGRSDSMRRMLRLLLHAPSGS